MKPRQPSSRSRVSVERCQRGSRLGKVPIPSRGEMRHEEDEEKGPRLHGCADCRKHHRSPSVDLGPAAALSCRECGERVALGPVFACEACFGPLRSRTTCRRRPRGAAQAHRGRPRTTSGATRRCCPSPPTWPTSRTSTPASPSSSRPTTSPASWASPAACTSRTTPATRRTPSRTASSPSPSRPPAPSASPPSPAPPPATSPAPSAPPPPAPASAPACSSRTTWSRARSSWPRSTAASWSASRATTTTSTASAPSSSATRPARAGASSTSTCARTTREGSKTLAYEICEQLGWQLPDQLVVPIASGSQLTKIDKGLQELIKLGLVEDKPYKIFGAQAEGCSPVSRGLQGRARRRTPAEAEHHRQVAGDRQPGRRAVRAGHRAPHRRRGGGRQRRADRRRDQAAGPDRGHLRGDRGWRDRRA